MATTQIQAEKTTTPCQSRRHIPADLFPEILSRLPVKSLLRFRSVSKPWLALVDDDADFARLHLNTFKNNSDHTRLFVEQSGTDECGKYIRECFVRCSDTFEPISEIPFTFWTACHIVSSLHGLILLQYETKKINHLWVWNPSIRELHEVPPLRKPKVLPCGSSLRDKELGLGYDPVANNYNIVRLFCYKNTLHLVAIYALGADSWKIIKIQDKGSPFSNWHWNANSFEKAVYFRSSLYFIAMDAEKDGVWDLVWLDLSAEVFSSVRMPEKDLQGFSLWTLVSVDGGSSLVAFDFCSSSLYTWLWVADRESMCWTKSHLSPFEDSRLMHIKKNGDLLACNRRSDSSANWDEVTSISHENEDCKTLQPQLHSIIRHVSCYVESLILHT